MRAALALLALALARGVSRPLLAQQVTWLYANSLDDASAFVADVLGLELATDQGPCRIYRSAPEGFLGVCDSRAAPASVPPVTYTLVVPDRAGVDDWHGFLSAQNAPGAPLVVNVTQPRDSDTFKCYAFNFYDPNAATGLGLYRFEVQAFLNEDWPQPTCPEI